MSEARAPKVALPARTAVGLREVREKAMARAEKNVLIKALLLNIE